MATLKSTVRRFTAATALVGATALTLSSAVVAITSVANAQERNLIGTEYEGTLDIPGWENRGGGLGFATQVIVHTIPGDRCVGDPAHRKEPNPLVLLRASTDKS